MADRSEKTLSDGGAELDREQQELEGWRSTIMSDLQGPDVAAATRALLDLTYGDPDRRAVEVVLMRQLSTPDVHHQVKELAVTCMGHIGRLHRAASPDVVHRLEGLLNDPTLCGRAEDALGDIRAFAVD